MKTLTKWLSQVAKNASMTAEEKYLSQATSLEDVERRQKEIARGEAPFQTFYSSNFSLNTYSGSRKCF
jgi:hypothetical protein